MASTFLAKNIYSKGPPPTCTAAARFAVRSGARDRKDGQRQLVHDLSRPPTKSMQAACADCHTTASFKSSVSHEHEMAGVTCSEVTAQTITATGLGAKRPAHRASRATARDTHTRVPPSAKTSCSRSPHGGADIGYPAGDGKWTWAGWPEDKWKKRSLPKTAAAFDIKNQFHIIHVDNGKPQERVRCSDCHTQGFDAANISKGVRESCATCHGATQTVASAGARSQCTSCHQQHTEGKDAFALVRAREVNASQSN
ncbi:MAG: cytochrome c3 family protein [Vicinamibacterales bacterium]